MEVKKTCPSTWRICPSATQNFSLWFSGTDTKTQCLLCACLTTQEDFLLSNPCTEAILMLHLLYGFLSFRFKQSPAARVRDINQLPSFQEPAQRLTKTAAQTWFSFCCYASCGFHFYRIYLPPPFSRNVGGWLNLNKKKKSKLELHRIISTLLVS